MDLENKMKMIIHEKGDATLKDASNKHMDVSGRGEIMVQEEYRIPHKIKVLMSRDLGQDELVVGLEDLKDLFSLHPEFPRTLPDKRREGAQTDNVHYNSIRGDQWCFAGYIINGNTQYPDTKKVEALTQFPLPTTQRELRGWMGLCNQLNHYIPGLAGEQAKFRKLLKKNVQFTVTE